MTLCKLLGTFVLETHIGPESLILGGRLPTGGMMEDAKLSTCMNERNLYFMCILIPYRAYLNMTGIDHVTPHTCPQRMGLQLFYSPDSSAFIRSTTRSLLEYLI